ncbi:hypothetical protein BBJ28_00023333 [Nothophytophthora sp. Chile5]|nr:hypothetical protein BBJ28_00023333 [Nothophytophthora sp. Chile5]
MLLLLLLLVCCYLCERDVGVMLTTDAHVRKLNRKHRKKDKPTDILSFPYHKVTAPGRFPRVASREERYLGDIYVSLAYVRRQCEDPELEEVTSLEERLPVLMAHGLCHLMGCVQLTGERAEESGG